VVCWSLVDIVASERASIHYNQDDEETAPLDHLYGDSYSTVDYGDALIMKEVRLSLFVSRCRFPLLL
jgi:hypothetical protein